MWHTDGYTYGVNKRDSNTDGYSHTDTNTNGSCHGYAYSHTHSGNANAYAYLHTGRHAWGVDASRRLSPIGVWSGCG